MSTKFKVKVTSVHKWQEHRGIEDLPLSTSDMSRDRRQMNVEHTSASWSVVCRVG